MRHETILKREDKSSVRITAKRYLEGQKPVYYVIVEVKGFRKRNWSSLELGDDYTYRGKSMKDRKVMQMGEYLKHCTISEIHQTKLKLWEKLKP